MSVIRYRFAMLKICYTSVASISAMKACAIGGTASLRRESCVSDCFTLVYGRKNQKTMMGPAMPLAVASRMRASLATALCEAIPTMKPVPLGRSQICEEEAKLQASCGSGARLGSKANRCESVINLVIPNMPKMLTGMSQNGKWAVFGLEATKAWTTSPSGNNRRLTFLFVTYTEHGKPVRPPVRAGRPQGKLLGVRVADAGKSECRSVIERIGIEGLPRHHPARKGADFRLVSHRKITDRTFLRGTGK